MTKCLVFPHRQRKVNSWLSGDPLASVCTEPVAWTPFLVYSKCSHTVLLTRNLPSPALSCSVEAPLSAQCAKIQM